MSKHAELSEDEKEQASGRVERGSQSTFIHAMLTEFDHGHDAMDSGMQGSTVTYFTFGVQYGSSPNKDMHPSGPTADGDGWWEVHGIDYEGARAIVFGLTEGKFAFAYDGSHWDPSWYPKGCLRRITVEDQL